MSKDVMLGIHGLRVMYGGLCAIDDVSLDLKPGVITGMIGPNGSGKSTLVGAISGQVSVTSGSITFKDSRIERMDTAARVRGGIARTFQVPRFPPELSVEEVLEVAELYSKRRPEGISRGSDRTHEVAALCSLADQLSTSCAQLTVPELRRLELARALCCNPNLVMLDEVMAGLGAAETEETVELVQAVAVHGVTVLIVEHVMRVMRRLCDELLVLDHGSLIASGSPEAVLSDNAVVGAYLGEL